MKKWSRHLLAAGALALGMSAAHASDNDTLYFYNWTEYVPPGLLEQFTKETGIKVIYSTYESNETMYAKLKTYKDGAYDLVVPSTYYVDKMRKEGMIQKIDKSKLTNFHNLDPEMLNKPFDPNNDYSVPYIWGATAIGVNSEGALKLINFLLRPDVAKEVAETIGYPTPNLAARKLLSPEVANDKSLYPDAQTISKGEWQNDVGDASAIYEEYYQKLKAGR